MQNPSTSVEVYPSATQSEEDNTTQVGYGNVYGAVLKNHAISEEAKALYAYLAVRSGKNDNCFPSQETIAKDLGFKGKYPERQIGRLTAQLEQSGVIKVVKERQPGGKWQNNNYILLITEGDDYGTIYGYWIYNPSIERRLKALYALFAVYLGGDTEYHGGDGKFWPKQTDIAAEFGCSVSTVEKNIRSLSQKKIIEIGKFGTGKLKGRNFYTIQIPQSVHNAQSKNNTKASRKESQNTERIPIVYEPYTDDTRKKSLPAPVKNVNLIITHSNNNTFNNNTLLSDSTEPDELCIKELKETANINNGSPNNESNLSANDWAVYLKVKEYCKQYHGVENFSISQFKVEVSNMGTVNPFEYDKIQEIGFWLLPAEIRTAV